MKQGLRDFFKDFKLISVKALPMAATFTFSIEILATGIMAIHLGDEESYAAASILFQAYTSTTMRLSLLPIPSVGIRISPFFGELESIESSDVIDGSRLDEARLKLGSIFKAGLIKCAIISVPAGITLLLSDKVLGLLGQSPEVVRLASQFLKVFSLSALPLAIRACIGQILYAKGDSNVAACISIVNLIIGTLSAIWLSRGYFGIESQGIAGIAWGYNIESYLTAIGYILYVSFSKKYANIPLFSRANWRNIGFEMKKLVTIGGPLALSRLVEVSMTFILSICAGLLSTKDQRTFSYSMQMKFLTSIFGTAFAQAVAYHVGKLMGSSEFERASRTAKNGLITTFIYIIPPCLFVNFYPQSLYSVLNIGGEQKQLVSKLLPLVLSGTVAQTGRYSINQVLRVLYDNKGSTMTSIIGMTLGIATAALLGLETEAALYGIASGLLIGEGASFLGLLWRWVNRIKPPAISEIKANPEIAEPKTWPSYFCSFFRYCSSTRAEQQPLFPATTLGSANGP